MKEKPTCPDCGSELGVLVHFSTTRIFALVRSKWGGWQEGKKVLRPAYPPERSDSACQNVACTNPECGYIGPEVCTWERPRANEGITQTHRCRKPKGHLSSHHSGGFSWA